MFTGIFYGVLVDVRIVTELLNNPASFIEAGNSCLDMCQCQDVEQQSELSIVGSLWPTLEGQ